MSYSISINIINKDIHLGGDSQYDDQIDSHHTSGTGRGK